MAELSIYKGDDKTYTLTFTDADGVAIDITGWTIYFTVKKNITDLDAAAVISKDITVHSNPTGGVSSIVLTDTDTGIDPRDYTYDIQIKRADGTIKTLVVDTLKIHQDITIRIA